MLIDDTGNRMVTLRLWRGRAWSFQGFHYARNRLDHYRMPVGCIVARIALQHSTHLPQSAGNNSWPINEGKYVRFASQFFPKSEKHLEMGGGGDGGNGLQWWCTCFCAESPANSSIEPLTAAMFSSVLTHLGCPGVFLFSAGILFLLLSVPKEKLFFGLEHDHFHINWTWWEILSASKWQISHF